MTVESPDIPNQTLTYEAINPTSLPRISHSALLSGSSDGIYVAGIDDVREFWRRGALFVDDPDHTGLFSDGIREGRYLYPADFTASVKDATLIGYRTVLTQDRRFFTDEGYAEEEVFHNQISRISRPDPFSNERTGLHPSGTERGFSFHPGERPVRHIEGSAVILCSDEPQSYGSFLFRILPKVKAVRTLGLVDLPCIVFAGPTPFRNLLELAGIPNASLVPHDFDTVTTIDHAIIPCLRNPHAYLDPESFDLYAELRAAFGSLQRGRKIYVSRLAINRSGRGNTRIMLNEAELIEKLKAIGFDIIEPENLSVQDQIVAFSSASLVVGPSGSGLFNTMFCHPGTKIIDIQTEPHWIYSYTGMYSSLGLEYGIFIGKTEPEDMTPVHKKFTVNIDALLHRIRLSMTEAQW